MDGKVSELVSGEDHSCALVDSTVKCWGSHSYGQLGTPTEETCGLGDGHSPCSYKPLTVNGLNAKKITAGSNHTCALLENNSVKCWGGGYAMGQKNHPRPIDVGELDGDVIDIASGENHTCAVVKNKVKCWGYNFWGQVGKTWSRDDYVAIPVEVPNIP